MLFFLIVFAVLGGGYALLFAFLPPRASAVVALLTLLVAGYLWSLPRYYLLDQTGGLGMPQPLGGPVVINEAETGRNWTFIVPVVFGDIPNLGKFSALLISVCMLAGGLVGRKAREGRARRRAGS